MSETMAYEKKTSLKEIIYFIGIWLKYFWKNLWVLFLTGILGAGVGVTISISKKPVYIAALNFALEEDKSSGGGLGGAIGLASSFGFDLGGSAGGAFSGANIIELMRSRRIVEKTLLDTVRINGAVTTFAEFYISINNWREQWKTIPGVNERLVFPLNAERQKFTLQQDSVLGIMHSNLLNENLNISQKDKKTSIMTITVKSKDEKFSKYFAEAVAQEISSFYIDTKSKKAKLNVEILQRQADSVRAELNGAITGVATAIDQTYNLNPAYNVQRAPSSKRQVDVQANTAILTQLVINLELAKVNLRKETPLIQIIDSPILPLKIERLGKRKALTIGFLIGGIIAVIYIGGKKMMRDLLS